MQYFNFEYYDFSNIDFKNTHASDEFDIKIYVLHNNLSKKVFKLFFWIDSIQKNSLQCYDQVVEGHKSQLG